jgi:hypothetical protein
MNGMGGYSEQIDIEFIYIERQAGKVMSGIRMKENSFGFAYFSDLFDILYGADFLIGVLNGDQ